MFQNPVPRPHRRQRRPSLARQRVGNTDISPISVVEIASELFYNFESFKLLFKNRLVIIKISLLELKTQGELAFSELFLFEKSSHCTRASDWAPGHLVEAVYESIRAMEPPHNGGNYLHRRVDTRSFPRGRAMH